MKLTFEAWKAQVDAEVEKLVHLSCDDIPDWDYYMAWQSSYTPKQAAREAVKAAKDY